MGGPEQISANILLIVQRRFGISDGKSLYKLICENVIRCCTHRPCSIPGPSEVGHVHVQEFKDQYDGDNELQQQPRCRQTAQREARWQR